MAPTTVELQPQAQEGMVAQPGLQNTNAVNEQQETDVESQKPRLQMRGGGIISAPASSAVKFVKIAVRQSTIAAVARAIDRSTLVNYNGAEFDKPLSQMNYAVHRRDTFRVPSFRKELKEVAKAAKAEQKKNEKISSDLTAQDGEFVPGWELTVGVEIHAQLNTAHKLFSPASTEPNDSANTQIAHFDLSIPGSQPLFQPGILLPALRAAIALGCTIQKVSRFDRKHYFYHDQPSGYQITQYYQPFATTGQVILNEADGLEKGQDVTVGIKQIQLEQDTARTQDRDEETSLIDFNRAGHPLIEIISLPHIHSPKIAAAYVRKIQAILFSVDSVTTGMELGGLRADINVSVRRADEQMETTFSYGGVEGLGQRTEIKNLSTFKGIEDAIKAERDRQITLIQSGGLVEGETRGWSVTNPGITRRLRGKEGEVDYRYMPDPDIPPLRISNEVVEYLTESLPPRPDELLKMLTNVYGLSELDAKALLLLDRGERVLYLQDVVDEVEHLTTPEGNSLSREDIGKTVGNWVLHEIGSLLTSAQQNWDVDKIPVQSLARIVQLQTQKKLTGSSAKYVLRRIFDHPESSVDDIVDQEGLLLIPLSEEEYELLANKVINQNPKQVQEIQKKGKHGKIMYLVGQMMKEGVRGRTEPKQAELILRRLILDNAA